MPQVRQAGYTELQATLWQRSNERAAARTDPAAQVALSRGLMQALDLAHGQLARCCGAGPVHPSPFSTGRQRSATAAPGADDAAAAAAGGARATKAAEVRVALVCQHRRVLQRCLCCSTQLHRATCVQVELAGHFYSALSTLVMQQHLSDPLSLWLVQAVRPRCAAASSQQVCNEAPPDCCASLRITHCAAVQAKELLESGAPLALPVLQQLLAKLASEFVRGCGLRRFNRFAAPLLGFVAACVGVAGGPAALRAMAADAGLGQVLYADWQQEPAAKAAAVSAAGGPGMHVAAEAAAGGGSAAATPRGAGAAASTPRGAAAAARASGASRQLAARGSMSMNVSSMRCRASSRLEPPGAANVAPSKPGIDAAAAAAAAEIAATVRSAAVTAAGDGGAAVKVRVPGIAGLIDVAAAAPQQSAGTADACAGRRCCGTSSRRHSSLSSSSSIGSRSSSVADVAEDEGREQAAAVDASHSDAAELTAAALQLPDGDAASDLPQ